MQHHEEFYILSVRFVDEDMSIQLFSSTENAVTWIERFGMHWEKEDGEPYFFVLASFLLDMEEEFQPMYDVFFYDKHGNILMNQPF